MLRKPPDRDDDTSPETGEVSRMHGQDVRRL
jgi:hypothetical protein